MSINNTNYGTSSLNNNSGDDNSAFGAYAAYNNLDGSCNTAIGSNSLFYNTTGNYNTGVGAGSLTNNDVGSRNTAVGSSALEGLVANQSVGNRNTAVGAQALFSNAGDYNTGLGTYAALDITTGNYNTFLGANTGFDNIANTYEYSTAIGYGAKIYATNQIMMGTSVSNVLIPGSAEFQDYRFGSYNDLSVVPKQYVDSVASGLVPSVSCLCATTASINGGGTPSGSPPTTSTDGVTITTGDNVLVINQGGADNTRTNNVNNGLWIVNLSGDWSRPASGSMSVGTSAKGDFNFIQTGTNYGARALVQISNPAIVGTNPLQYTIFYQLNVSAGEGLNVTTQSGKQVLAVDSSLNFINYLDNSVGPNAGTLNIGAYTTNTIIGPTGGNGKPVIVTNGITGPTGSFTKLYVSGPSTQDGLITNLGGITGATGSFTKLYVSGPSTQDGLITNLGGITGPTGSFSNVFINTTNSPDTTPLIVVGNNNNAGNVTTAAFFDRGTDKKSDIAVGIDRTNNMVIGYLNSSYPSDQFLTSFSFLSLFGGSGGTIAIDNNGVGIGYGETKPPNSTNIKLDVNGNLRVNQPIYINNSGLTSANVLYFNNSSTNGTTGNSYYLQQVDNAGQNFFRMGRYNINGLSPGNFSDLVINSSGNVGIGTATPSWSFEVDSSTGSPLRIRNSLALGTSVGNTSQILQYSSNLFGNNSLITMYNYRFSAGNDWIGVSTRLQQTIDSTGMGYIEFNCPLGGSFSGGGSIGLYGYRSSSGLEPSGITINPSGLVGIGTTTPTKPLEILGPSGGLLKLVNNTFAYQGGQSNIEFWNNNAPYNNYRLGQISAIDIATSPNVYRSALALSAGFHIDGFVEGMRIVAQSATSAFVGIGTITPLSFLEVKGSASTAHNVPPDGGASHNLNLTSTKTGTTTYSMALGVDFTSGAGYINAAGNGLIQPVCLQTRGGNVGIGTTSPTAPLHVIASSNTYPANNGVYIYNPTNSANQHAICAMRVAGTLGGNAFSSYDVNQEQGWSAGMLNIDNTYRISALWDDLSNNTMLAISVAGNVGIGTNNPAHRLDVNGELRCRGQLFIGIDNPGLGTGDTAYLQYAAVSGEQTTLRIVVQNDNNDNINLFPSGNVGIKTDTPANTLDVNGTCRATTFVSGSDYRLKTNIETLLPSRTIDELKPVEYDISGNVHDMGFIAHEVEEVLPFLVHGTKDGENMQSLNYNGFIALLVKEVQELKRENKIFKEKLEQITANNK